MKEFISRLTWVDYMIFIALLRGFYVGYRSGFFPEILRIAAYLVTVLLAFNFYEPLAQQLTLKTFLNHATASGAAFISILILAFAVTKLVTMLILKMLKVGEGGFILRFIGLLLGGFRWIVLLSLVFMLIDNSPLSQLKTDIHARSVIGNKVAQIGPLAFDYLSNLSPQLGLPRK